VTGGQALLACVISLPANFRPQDILAFHRRDSAMVAERVEGDALHKGLSWAGHPACLGIRFYPGRTEVTLAMDGPATASDTRRLESMARRMLGLTQAVDAFEQRHRDHPQMGPRIAAKPGLRVPVAPTPFEALSWAITGQQISLSAALSLRRKLIQAAGPRHSSGLWCHPDAAQLARLSEADLRQAGYSRTKAQTLLALSQAVEAGELPLEAWADAPPVDEIRARLSRIRGIGPWTINYALLRGFGWLDGSLHGDAAVRRGLQTLLGRPEKLTEEEARHWLADFSPWRALVAAHLWAGQP
jgi:DNA-3-methyladenine glycosylase II